MNFPLHSTKMWMSESPHRPNELSPYLLQAINTLMERVMVITAAQRDGHKTIFSVHPSIHSGQLSDQIYMFVLYTTYS